MEDVVNILVLDDLFISILVSDIELVILAVDIGITVYEISGNNLILTQLVDQGIGKGCPDLSTAPCDEDPFLRLYYKD